MRCEIIGACELYLGDCLEILPKIKLPEIKYAITLVTDPVWPNNSVLEFSYIEPYKLFADAWKLLDGFLERAVIQPRILNPITLPFFRVAWLKYAVPGHKGRLLYTGDIAYMFGKPPKAILGKKLISGECISSNNFCKEAEHPCPRKLDHVKWLIYQFTDPEDIILDPFMGSGTTGVACAEQQCKFIGIEINKKYFDIACKRIEKIVNQKILDFGGAA